MKRLRKKILNWWHRNHEPYIVYYEDEVCGGLLCEFRMKEWGDGEWVYRRLTNEELMEHANKSFLGYLAMGGVEARELWQRLNSEE